MFDDVHLLDDIVRSWRSVTPDDIAVVIDDSSVTIGTFAQLVDDLSAGITAVTEPGDRVAVLAANGLGVAALLYAVPAAGRVLVPLNTRHAPAELTEQLHRTHARLLLGTDSELLRLGPTAAHPDPLLRVSLDGDAGDLTLTGLIATGKGNEGGTDIEADSINAAHADDIAWIIFTSGTTGRPKGVQLTHASLLAAVRTTAAGRPLAADDVYLYPFPLYHVAAYNLLHAHARRRPVVLLPRFDAARLIELTSLHAVTSMSLAPTMLRMLLDELATNPAFGAGGLTTLRTINYGASAMPESLLREAVDKLGCGFAQGYGMTELSGNAVFLSPDDHLRGLAGETRLLRAAGYPGEGVQLLLVDDHGTTVPVGTVGEVTVAADQVCAGYLDDPDSTAATIVDGWLQTGDLGVLDEDGLLHIVDRAKDVVVTGGENVSSREVEEAILSHPAIAQVAVIGLPDGYWGEAVTAVVVPSIGDRPEGDDLLEVLRNHVGDHLAGYKKPRRVEVVDELPVNAGGKVDKRALRARFG